jgi:hypothetical protein
MHTHRVSAHFYFKGFRFILLPKYYRHLYWGGGGLGMFLICILMQVKGQIFKELHVKISHNFEGLLLWTMNFTVENWCQCFMC